MIRRFISGSSGTSGQSGGDSNRWMFSAHGLNPPYTSLTTVSSQVYGVSVVEHVTPSYPISKIRFGFSNFYVKFGGEANPETDPASSLAVRAAYSLDGGSTWTSMLFDGTAEATLAAGTALKLSDTITFGSPVRSQQILIRTYRACATGDVVPATWRYSTSYIDSGTTVQGCFYTATQATALALLSGGTLTNNAGGSGIYYYGPSTAVTDGWDGRPVGLVVGDSIAFGPSVPGRSYITTALDNNSADGRRYPYASFAIAGTRPSDQASITAGQFRRRDEMIQQISALNNGKMPFTFILSELCVNSGADATLDAEMQTWWAFLTSRFGCPIVQTSPTPQTTSATDKWATYSGQTATEDYRWTVHANLPGHARAGRIAGWIDISPATTGDPGRPHTWPVPGWYSTLAADCASGASTLSLTDPPGPGWALALDPGITGAEAVAPVNTVTGTGPYTVTLGQNTASAHTAGAVVQAVSTRDGTHPVGLAFTALTARVLDAKNSGLFERVTANQGSWS